MLNNTQNYYIGYPPTKDIEDFESVIVGEIKQHVTLSNGQIVVKTPLGVKDTAKQLQGFEKLTRKEAQERIEKIEYGFSDPKEKN